MAVGARCFVLIMLLAISLFSKTMESVITINTKNENVLLANIFFYVDNLYKRLQDAIEEKPLEKECIQYFKTSVTVHYYFLKRALNMIVKESFLKKFYRCGDQDSSLKEFHAQLHCSYCDYLHTISAKSIDEFEMQLSKDNAYLQFNILQENIKTAVIEHMSF